jgi:hypothetical protein
MRSTRVLVYICAVWFSMSLMAYGIAIKRYAATLRGAGEQAMVASSGGNFLIAGLLLVPALLLLHVGFQRLKLSSATSPES